MVRNKSPFWFKILYFYIEVLTTFEKGFYYLIHLLCLEFWLKIEHPFKMATSTTTTTLKPEEEIQKLMNSLDPEKNNIDKITEVTQKYVYWCLLEMQLK